MSFRKAVSSSLMTQAIVAVLSLLYSMFLARFLLPAGRGQYALLTVYHTGLATVSLLGLDQAICYLMARGVLSAPKLLGHGLVFVLAASALATVIGLPIAIGFPSLLPNTEPAMRLFALGVVPFEVLTLVQLNILLGCHNVRDYNRVNLLRSVLPVVLIPVVVRGGWGLVGVLLSDVLVWAAASLFGLHRSVAAVGRPDFGLRPSIIREALKYGIPAQSGNVVTFVNLRCSVYLLSILSQPLSVGLYAVGLGLAEKLTFFSARIATLLVPRVSADQAHPSVVADRTAFVFRTVLWALAAGGIALATLAPPIIHTLYSAAYGPAVPAARVLVAGSVCAGASSMLFSYFLGVGSPIVPTLLLLVTTTINVPVSVWAISVAGPLGAAWSNSGTQLLALVAILLVFSRVAGLRIKSVMLPRRSDFIAYLSWLGQTRRVLMSWRKRPGQASRSVLQGII